MAFAQSAGELIRAEAPVSAGRRPSAITTFGGLSASYEAIYSSQPAVRTVVSFLARNVASLKPKLYERVSDDERRHVGDHDLAKLLRRPFPRLGRHRFLLELVSDLGIFDNYVAIKVRDNGARGILRVPPQNVEPLGDFFFPSGYRIVGPRGRTLELDHGDVLHLRGYNPTSSSWGLSPIETLRRTLSEDIAAGDYREQFWRRGARLSGYIKRPTAAPKWSPEARDRFLEQFNARYGGDAVAAGGTAIFEEGMEFEEAGVNARDSEYLGARKLTRREVAAEYGVQPGLVGLAEDVTAAALSEQRRNAMADSLGPLLDFIADELSVDLFEEYGLDPDRFYVEFNLAAKLEGSFTERAEVMSRAMGGPWLLRNEGRAMDNLPPVDGGDELIVPLNVLVGGRASPADTAPGTPGAGQAARKALPAKAATAPPMVSAWANQHRSTLESFVDRQRRSVMSRLGAGDLPGDAFDTDRWDTELGNDLAGLALAMAPDAAEPIVEAFALEDGYNLAGAEAWLINNARLAAEGFNAATLRALSDAYAGNVPTGASRKDAADELADEVLPATPLELAAAAFVAAKEVRAAAAAVTRSTMVTNFVRHDAAQQAGAGEKTWMTTSGSPRSSHADVDGETVPLSEPFSNGMMWPGDPAGGAEETAHCVCIVDFSPGQGGPL